jgi:hypothetical protein
MSTLRVSNIEAKADASSPSVNEKLKITNSNGELLIHIDGATSGITTVGISTSGESFRFDSNQNVTFFGDIATSGKLNISGISTFGNGLNVTSSDLNVTTGQIGVKTDSPDHSLHVYSGTLGIGKSENTGFEITITDNNLSFSRDAKSYINQNGSGTISVRLGSPKVEVAEFVDAGITFPAGKGVSFINADDIASGETVSSSVLDDYEEGTFTPTVSVEGQSNATTDKQYGRYVKIGKKVTVWCYVQLNGTPSGRGVNNAWQHGGLPFTHRDVAGGYDIGGPILYWTLDDNGNVNGTGPYHLTARLFNNSTGGRIRGTDSSSNQYGQNISYLLKDNTEYTYTFTYETTA